MRIELTTYTRASPVGDGEASRSVAHRGEPRDRRVTLPGSYALDLNSTARVDLPNHASRQCALDLGQWHARAKRRQVRSQLPEHREYRPDRQAIAAGRG